MLTSTCFAQNGNWPIPESLKRLSTPFKPQKLLTMEEPSRKEVQGEIPEKILSEEDEEAIESLSQSLHKLPENVNALAEGKSDQEREELEKTLEELKRLKEGLEKLGFKQVEELKEKKESEEQEDSSEDFVLMEVDGEEPPPPTQKTIYQRAGSWVYWGVKVAGQAQTTVSLLLLARRLLTQPSTWVIINSFVK